MISNKFSIIHPESKIEKSSFVDEFTVIGRGVIIEDDVYISQGVKIYGNAIIRQGTYIGQNCIIGHPQRSYLDVFISKKKSLIECDNPLVIINNNCIIRAGSIIYSEVEIGKKCQTGHNVLIREKTKIGDFSLIGTNCIIDGNSEIGMNANIQTGVYIPLHCIIKDNVFMGPFSKLTNDKYMLRKKFKLKGPIIEECVSLGANCVILPGVRVKKNTIIGAGSVVTKDTEESDIIMGNPAKFQKKIPENWK